MAKLNGLLDGEFTVKTVGEPKNGGVINKILIAATLVFAVVGATVFVDNMNNSAKSIKVIDSNLISMIKDKVTSNDTNQNTEVHENKFPVYNSSLVNDNNREKLNKAGDFELEGKLADNQVARKVAQIQFSSKNYFLSVVSENEGFRSHIYNDNVGYATGNGWNASLQTISYNAELSKTISQTPIFIEKMKQLSGKMSNKAISPDYKDVTIAPQRAIQIAELMGEKFEIGVINGIAKAMSKNSEAIKRHKENNKDYNLMAKELYQSLAPNEQAALKYHCYRLGEGGFSKYKEMLSEVINYGYNTKRTPEASKAIADKLVTKFTLNGKIYDDIRGSLYTSTLFSSVEAYGYLIGKNVAPRNMSSLNSQLKENNVDGSAEPGQVKVSDPYGDAKAKLEAGDNSIKLNIITDNAMENIKNMRKESIKNMKAMPSGSFF